MDNTARTALRQAQAHDQAAALEAYRGNRSEENLERLVRCYEYLVKYVVNKFGLVRRDATFEDWMSYGLAGLVEGLVVYDPEKTTMALKTFLVWKIKNSIIDQLRIEHGRPEGQKKDLHSRIEYVGDIAAHSASMSAVRGEDDEAIQAVWIGRILDRLPPEARMVITRHIMMDEPAQEIAAELGVTAGRISQIRTAALKHLRRLLLTELNVPAESSAIERKQKGHWSTPEGLSEVRELIGVYIAEHGRFPSKAAARGLGLGGFIANSQKRGIKWSEMPSHLRGDPAVAGADG